MIAVALTPIVLLTGIWAGNRWPVVTIHRVGAGSLVGGLHYFNYGELSEFSTRSAILAMAATTAVLAGLWALLVRWSRRDGRGSPPEDDGRVDVADPPE
jgi:hypothetical protein